METGSEVYMVTEKGIESFKVEAVMRIKHSYHYAEFCLIYTGKVDEWFYFKGDISNEEIFEDFLKDCNIKSFNGYAIEYAGVFLTEEDAILELEKAIVVDEDLLADFEKNMVEGIKTKQQIIEAKKVFLREAKGLK